MRRSYVLSLAAAWTMAALAGTPGRADPLRTIVYRFSDAEHGYASYASMATNGTGDSMTEVGVRETTATSMHGGDGTITAQIQSATADGGLVVDVIEKFDRAPRAMQTVRCAVYGGANKVVCDQNLEVTAEETAVLTYIGRFFYDPSRLDPKRHWQVSESLDGGRGSIITDYTVARSDGPRVTIDLNRVQKAFSMQVVTTGSLDYDESIEAPRSGHLSTDVNAGGNFGTSVLDFHLISDSIEKASPENSH